MNLREPKLLQNVFFVTVVELAHVAVVTNARGKKINALFCLVLFAFGHVLGVQGAMGELAALSIAAGAAGCEVATKLGLEELLVDFEAHVCACVCVRVSFSQINVK